MPPPRGGVQAGSVVCGDHPKNQMPWPLGRAPQEVENQLACAELSKLPGMRVAELITYAELHAGCHMGTGPMRSRPICESERLIVWLWLCGPMAGTAEPMEFPECSSRTPAWCEFLRRIMIAGEEPCVLSAPKGKPRRGCATAGFPAPGPTGDRNYWGRQGNAPAPPVFRDARYATPNPAEAHRRWRGRRASRSGSVSATHTLSLRSKSSAN